MIKRVRKSTLTFLKYENWCDDRVYTDGLLMSSKSSHSIQTLAKIDHSFNWDLQNDSKKNGCNLIFLTFNHLMFGGQLTV